jgi:peptidoglycan/xylan/chitin deacetylase (PgdA/CDA1 family)
VAVVVLMYHHTPADAAQGFYDVPLTTLRAQVEALREAGANFIDFGECGRRDYVERGLHVALTFDDGHASNEAAFRFLADAGVTPTAFVVRDWSRQDGRYLSAAALGDLKGVVALGGHGATHRALDLLPAGELADELAASRDYVGDISGVAPATMALPGGHGGARELAAAARVGFSLVGNSRALPHRRLGASVNRLCVHSGHDALAPLRWVEASAWRWSLASARLTATRSGRRLMGPRLYGALAALAK